jgi:hypothetical protein
MNASSFEVVIHAGPPKTATTSIQEFLTANLDELRKLGWYYLLGPNIPAAHHVAARLLNWDARLIGTRVSSQSLNEDFTDMFNQAKAQDSFKILISSECLSKLKREQWGEFVSALTAGAAAAGSSISSVTITYTDRDFEKKVSSSYAEGLKRGFKLDRVAGEAYVRQILQQNDEVVYGLADLFTMPCSFKIIDFDARGEHNNFVAHWVSEVLDPRLALLAAEFNGDNQLNQRDSIWIQNRLQEFNVWNTPDSEDPFHAFLVQSENQEESFAAMQRLIYYRGLLVEFEELNPENTRMALEIESLQNAIKSYEVQSKLVRQSLSWRVTAPLRAIAGLFKR